MLGRVECPPEKTRVSGFRSGAHRAPSRGVPNPRENAPVPAAGWNFGVGASVLDLASRAADVFQGLRCDCRDDLLARGLCQHVAP
jgi:hypothetical protein